MVVSNDPERETNTEKFPPKNKKKKRHSSLCRHRFHCPTEIIAKKRKKQKITK